jgi:DNA-binding NtrC family response regulator
MIRGFFRMVAESAFSNPFSSERVEIDRRIVGADENTGWDELLALLLKELEKNIAELGETKAFIARRELDEDCRAVTVGILFHVFHKYMADFDAFICLQVGSPERRILSADFLPDVYADLVMYGFSAEESERYLGIFFQMRRAFYFINRDLIGSSQCMRQLRERMWQNLFTFRTDWYERFLWNCMEDFSTLLLGETGTGKGAVAAAIGQAGFIPYHSREHRFDSSFVDVFIPINLSQFSETLIESELFGHCKGAFTGAVEDHKGVFARCSQHGAIFLDEIGEVSLPIQIKLLKVLQERTFSPVGGHKSLRFSGRVIAATNRPVDELRESGAMRDDFYYRLCSDEITMPPLRQRIQEDPNELELMTEHILTKLCPLNGSELKASVLKTLRQCVGKNYSWPGNVRELEQAVRRILLTGKYEPQNVRASGLESKMRRGELSAKELTEYYCRELYDQLGNFGEVARRLDLDWRTVKKYVTGGA